MSFGRVTWSLMVSPWHALVRMSTTQLVPLFGESLALTDSMHFINSSIKVWYHPLLTTSTVYILWTHIQSISDFLPCASDVRESHNWGMTPRHVKLTKTFSRFLFRNKANSSGFLGAGWDPESYSRWITSQGTVSCGKWFFALPKTFVHALFKQKISPR